MAKSYDYQSAFDIIGPVMMGPSSSHTAGAVKIGNSARAVLGDMPKTLEIHYYESFAKTHQGHGTDVAVVGGAMGYSTFDSRIKSALDIARDENIDVDIIEEDGKVSVNILTVLILRRTLKVDVTLKSLVFQLVAVQLNLKALTSMA